MVCSLFKTLNSYRSEYLTVKSWQDWWNELVETVRTSRRSADNDESPAVEVLNYRSPDGYFASEFIFVASTSSRLFVHNEFILKDLLATYQVAFVSFFANYIKLEFTKCNVLRKLWYLKEIFVSIKVLIYSQMTWLCTSLMAV